MLSDEKSFFFSNPCICTLFRIGTSNENKHLTGLFQAKSDISINNQNGSSYETDYSLLILNPIFWKISQTVNSLARKAVLEIFSTSRCNYEQKRASNIWYMKKKNGYVSY